jgi:hypothetical protein
MDVGIFFPVFMQLSGEVSTVLEIFEKDVPDVGGGVCSFCLMLIPIWKFSNGKHIYEPIALYFFLGFLKKLQKIDGN